MKPLISVIVPVYGVEPYLPRCVDSILGQTHQNLEVILVDDGSPDGCGALCDRYAQQDGRVRVIHQENGGAAAARNAGIAAATGDYLAFVDGDDWIATTMYQALLDAMGDAHTGALCLFFGAPPPRPRATVPWDTLWQSLLQGDLLMSSLCNKLYRRSAWAGLSLDSGIRFTEDLWANYQVFSRAPGAVLVPEPLYHYEVRRDSAMRTVLKEAHFDALTISDRLAQAVAGDGAAEACVARQRSLIQLSLINRILKSGQYRERYTALRQDLLSRKAELLKSPLSTTKERWSIRLLDRRPALYRAAVRTRR